MKKASILIRSFNSAATIERSLLSALNQSIPSQDYEIILVDDGSSDETLNIISKWNHRLTIVTSPHLGAVAALNLALSKVRTPYYTILDADDFAEPRLLKLLLRTIGENPKAAFAYCDYFEIEPEKESKVVTTENIFNTIAAGILFRTDAVKYLGGYDESLFFPEYDLLIKLMERSTGVRLAVPLYNYLRRFQSYTGDSDQVKNGVRQLEDKYGRHFPIRDYALKD